MRPATPTMFVSRLCDWGSSYDCASSGLPHLRRGLGVAVSDARWSPPSGIPPRTGGGGDDHAAIDLPRGPPGHGCRQRRRCPVGGALPSVWADPPAWQRRAGVPRLDVAVGSLPTRPPTGCVCHPANRTAEASRWIVKRRGRGRRGQRQRGPVRPTPPPTPTPPPRPRSYSHVLPPRDRRVRRCADPECPLLFQRVKCPVHGVPGVFVPPRPFGARFIKKKESDDD